MVISKSKVNLASKRLYNEVFSQGRSSILKNGGKRVPSLGTNFSSAYTTAESHSNNSSFYANHGACSRVNVQNDTYYGFFTYSRNAKLIADEQSHAAVASAESVGSTNSLENVQSMYDSARERIFLSLMEILRRLSFRGDFEDYYSNCSSVGNNNVYHSSPESNNSSGSIDMSATTGTLSITNSGDASVWTVEDTYSTFYGESEYTSFSGSGTVVTADGTEVNFDVTMEMSRTYMEQSNLTYITKFPKILTDPLIINLDCNPTDIQDKTFLFDLDCDGKKEEIAALSKGSGYLALDINGDGIINDGSELFGTSSGDGFKDLSVYDSDGNGWIDEADDIYKKLTVWTTDSDGNPVLLSLKDADVGAIYLGNSKTQFDLKNDNSELMGRVRSSGIYLHENGTAGTVQQVDF